LGGGIFFVKHLNYLRLMISVSVLGYGNVAWHLIKAFEASKGVNLVQVYNKSNLLKKDFEASFTTELSQLTPVQIYIITIPDDYISKLSKLLDCKDCLVVHTSGSLPLNALQCPANKGVFYPLQSFSKYKTVNFVEIPIAVEAENTTDLNLLKNLANSLSPLVYEVDSHQRKQLHLAAVFVNNFVNHMYRIGEELCLTNNIDFNILKPLIKETALKIKALSPKEAQTGPAKRHDRQTIKNHLEILPKEYQEIYTLLTKSIEQDDKKL
jgi:predicted short-subunit dehydrogenase-like oxidoreductase (DUF2520 family)